MPLWSNEQWRACIGSCWCALGRPFNTRFTRNRGKSRGMLTLHQVATMVIMMMLLIAANLGLVVTQGHHRSFLNMVLFGDVIMELHALRFGLILLLFLLIMKSSVDIINHLLSSKVKTSLGQFFIDLTHCLWLIRHVIHLLLCPVMYVLNLGTAGINCVISEMFDSLSNKEERSSAVTVVVIVTFQLFVTVSVARSVIFFLLLTSGDVEQNPGPDQLTVRDLKTVRKAVWDARTKWLDIGLELDLNITDLDAIDAEHHGDIGSCFMKMLTLWLKQVDPPPTWSAMIDALKEPIIGFKHLGEEVERKFAPQSSKPLDTTDAGPATGATVCNVVKTCASSDDTQWPLPVDDECEVEPKRKIRRTDSGPVIVPISRNVVKLEDYAEDLKSDYKFETYASTDNIKWPPPVDENYKVFRLEMVKAERNIRRTDIDSDWVRCKTIREKVDEVVNQRVPIELKDIFKKIDGQRKRVLMEGAPGCGKSTLSFHICHQWADGKLFQDYKLVILMRLRNLAVQEAKTIDDLLQKTIGEVADEIKTNKGRNVLFVLDGWDEIHESKPGYSVILDLIKSKELRESSIIITSRPTSSAVLHQLVSLRTEILGFSKSELRSYFSFCLKDDTKAVEDLLKRIKNNPIIEGICYLPLNASILVHLFICEKGVLPDTQYGIFSDLICNCIFRYLKRTQTDADEIKSLDELPLSVDSQFQRLCELAYEGIMKDEVIFHLDSSFATLDLLQRVESVGRCGMSYSYNFLHLSIQELLAAIHIATKLNDDDQTEKFKELYNNPRFAAVFQFYAANTQLKTPGISDVIVQVARFGEQPLLLSLLYCLYEAQDSSLCQLVADQLESKLYLSHTTLGIAECFSLQYFLTHLENFDIKLYNCSIDDDECKVLFKPGQVYPFQSLDLSKNPLGNEGALIVSNAIKNMDNLQSLDLRITKIDDKGIEDVLSVVKTMTTLQSLDIGVNSISHKGGEAIMEAMKEMTNLQHFKLGLSGIGREGALAVLTAMKAMTTFPCMDLSGNDLGEGAAALSDILKTMTNLHYLDLHDNDIKAEGCVAISEALRKMTNLQHLDLSENHINAKGCVAISEALGKMTNLQHLNLHDNDIRAEGCVAISEALGKMTNLQHLDLSCNDIDADWCVAISEALGKMTNLQHLNLLYNSLQDEGVVTLSEAMKTMTNLQHLDLGGNSIATSGTVALSVAMEAMTNLQFLNLHSNSIDDEGAIAISAPLKKMTNLQDLDLDDNPIGDEGAEALAEAMKTMTNLQILEFGQNSVSYEGAMTVLAAIRTMTNLKRLRFYDQPLGDDGALAVLEVVKMMPSLKELDVKNDDDKTPMSEVGKKALEEAQELVKARKSKRCVIIY